MLREVAIPEASSREFEATRRLATLAVLQQELADVAPGDMDGALCAVAEHALAVCHHASHVIVTVTTDGRLHAQTAATEHFAEAAAQHFGLADARHDSRPAAVITAEIVADRAEGTIRLVGTGPDVIDALDELHLGLVAAALSATLQRWVTGELRRRNADAIESLRDARAERRDAEGYAARQGRMLDLIPDPVIARTVDGTIFFWNAGAAATYGRPAADALGRKSNDLLCTRFLTATAEQVRQQLTRVGRWSGDVEQRCADGRVLRMRSTFVRDEREGGESVILEINSDITERVAAEQALAVSEGKFRSQFANSTIGQMIRDVDGIIEDANPAFCTMLGYDSPQELIGAKAASLYEAETAKLRSAGLVRLTAGEIDAMKLEGVMLRRDGSPLDVEINVSVARDADGEIEHIVGIFVDITDRKIAERALSHRALHDPLTGLANRALLADRIAAVLADPPTDAGRVGLLYLDLDGFKSVNDTFGHATGDMLLGEVAQRLIRCVRAEDTVARLGGDEFVLLCSDLESEAALDLVASRVLNALSAPYALGEARVTTVSASIGMAFPDAEHDAATALRDADRAMYAAKRAGKNAVRRQR